MDRLSFFKKGLLGAGAMAAAGPLASALGKTASEEVENLGFNHLPTPESKVMANMILHKAATRGHANHGWLDSHHTFSFASYYDPKRMNFGVLRVLNDDHVAPGMGFGTHPHDNMEIISIPLEGDLEHKDSMGNTAVIKRGDIQVMSAGMGITHSEYNRNKDQAVKFLQIWVFPKTNGVKPRYDQLALQVADRHNKLQQVLSPNPDDDGVWVHQDAWFHMGNLDAGLELEYALRRKGNGVYVFLLEGDLTVNGQALNRRDGLGVWDTDSLSLRADSAAEVLLMEVPMAL